MTSSLILVIVFSIVLLSLLLIVLGLILKVLRIIEWEDFKSERLLEAACAIIFIMALINIMLSSIVYQYGYQVGQSDYSLGEIRFQNYKGNVISIKDR